MAESATVERVDMNIGGDGGEQHAETDWGKMTPEQQSASVDEAYASVRERRAQNRSGKPKQPKLPSMAMRLPPSAMPARKPAEETVVEGEDEGGGQDWLDQEAQTRYRVWARRRVSRRHPFPRCVGPCFSGDRQKGVRGW